MVDDFELNEELIVIDDLDLTDDSRLRQVVVEVESLLGYQGRGLRLSILTAEQWDLVVKRMIKKSLQRGAERYFHMIKDPRDPQHLLISPSAVRSINEDSRQIYQELIYSSMRCIPTDLPRPLRRGVDDILAKEISKKINIKMYSHNYPMQADFVTALLNILVINYGYSVVEWAILLRRSPSRIIVAITKSSFYAYWKKEIMKDFKIDKSNDLPGILTTDPLIFSTPIVKRSKELMLAYAKDRKNG